MTLILLNDIIIIFLLSIVVIFIFHKIHLPSIVGFLITGIIAGPHGLGLIVSIKEVEIIAEIGIVLLLFTIGLEFSFRQLLSIRKSVLLGGSLQVGITFLIIFLIQTTQGLSFKESLIIGFLVSLSSTAIVLKLIHEKGEMNSPHGRTTLAILIFQDIMVIPIMLLMSVMGKPLDQVGQSLVILLIKAALIIVSTFICAKWIVPYVFYQVTRTRIRELFLLSVLGLCLVIVWLNLQAGLSLAMGAFLAGLIISESEYSHEALGNILPFRDVFISFFFVSIGMLLNYKFFLAHPGWILSLTLGTLIIKSMIGGLATLILGLPLRTAIMVGVGISQIGEFSFIIMKASQELNIFSDFIYQTFLIVSVITMITTTFIITWAPSVADAVLKLPIPEKVRSGMETIRGEKWTDKTNHLVIIGFGLNGRNLARAAGNSGIPYIIIEMNPETVKKEKSMGTNIFFGDATSEAVLRHGNIQSARIAVVAISDPSATRRIVRRIRKMNSNINVIVRTRFVKELEPLFKLGASEVIPEEFETSVEIFTRVLNKYLVPSEEIHKFVKEVRADNYDMFRSISRKGASISEVQEFLSKVEVNSCLVKKESPIAYKTLEEVGLNKKHGVAVLAIKREGKMNSNPDGSFQIFPEDLLILMGQPENVGEVTSTYL